LVLYHIMLCVFISLKLFFLHHILACVQNEPTDNTQGHICLLNQREIRLSVYQNLWGFWKIIRAWEQTLLDYVYSWLAYNSAYSWVAFHCKFRTLLDYYLTCLLHSSVISILSYAPATSPVLVLASMLSSFWDIVY
jgi:hypothetical protein